MREDWDSFKLKEVCEIRPQKREVKEVLKETDLVSFVPMSQLNEELKKFEEEETRQLKDVYKGYTYFKDGDVLLAKITPCFENGKMGIAKNLTNGVGFGSSEYIVYRPNDRLIADYLFYFFLLPDFRATGVKTMGGAVGHQRIQKDFYEEFEIPIPPLPEQKRIVEILDEAFEAIDQAKANIEKNIQNAEELFQSKLNEIFSQKGEGWEELTLEDIAIEFGRGKSKHRPRNAEILYGGEYPFIQTGDVRNANKYVTEYSQTYNEVGLKQSKLWPDGTICITIAANIAESAILGFEGCFPDSIIGVVTDQNKATNSYAYYCLQYFKADLQAKGKGSAQDNINLGTFKEQYFPFPNIPTQKRIVNELDSLTEATNLLIENYSSSLEQLEELKKSILQKAFSGELTGGESSRMLGTGLEDEQDELVSKAAEPGVEYEG